MTVTPSTAAAKDPSKARNKPPSGSTTKIMQNLRKEEDYRYDKETRRRKIKINNGIIPRASTLQKYGITVAEVNAIRAKANLPPIEIHLFHYTALKTHETLQMEINAQSERTLKEKVRSENIKLTEEVDAYK